MGTPYDKFDIDSDIGMTELLDSPVIQMDDDFPGRPSFCGSVEPFTDVEKP